MDANFMNAKEMKYNVERKKKKHSLGRVTYILLHLFIHNLLLFTAIAQHTQKTTADFLLHNHSFVLIFYCFFFSCCCFVVSGKILDMNKIEGGTRVSSRDPKCCNCPRRRSC